MAELYFLNNSNKNDIELDLSFLRITSNLLNLDEAGTNEAIELYSKNAKMILGSLKHNNSILVNGEVQSGKTNNLIVASASLNKEDKYDVIVYLSGRLNMINEQNHERFFSVFDNFREKYFTTKIINPRKIDESTVQIIREGKTLLINMLKEPQRLEGLLDVLKKYKLSFILINDEGDDTSLSPKGIRVFKSLKDLNNKKKIITITGSPYENLTHEYLYDDYIVLESSPHYTGIEKFDYDTLDMDKEKQISFVLKEWMIENINNSNSQLLINTTLNTEEHLEISKYIKEQLWIISKFDDEIDENIKNIASEILLEDKVEITNSNFELTQDRGMKIIIGGHNLSRGVTFKDLTHQLLISDSSKVKAGTLIQRARWCGYRDPSKMKIYVNKDLKESFIELIDLQKWTKEYEFGKNEYSKIFKGKQYKKITLKG